MHLPPWSSCMAVTHQQSCSCRKDSAGRKDLCSSCPSIAHSSAHLYCRHSCGSDLRAQWHDTAQGRSNIPRSFRYSYMLKQRHNLKSELQCTNSQGWH